MIANQDVVKDLRVGMLIAVAGKTAPRVGTVQAVPHAPTEDAEVEVSLLQHRREHHTSQNVCESTNTLTQLEVCNTPTSFSMTST